uniref:Uncharacterized protein n=1 Tax=Anguilla anguilla TaxID=7936 RepID=A0A0E9TKE3_ANGAN
MESLKQPELNQISHVAVTASPCANMFYSTGHFIQRFPFTTCKTSFSSLN